MTTFNAALTLIAQTGGDAPQPPPRCLYCTQPADIGKTCAAHVKTTEIMAAVHAARPLVDSARCIDRERTITLVMTALEKAGREPFAGRFAERAEKAPGMNALFQIAKEYVRLESSL